MKDWAKESDLIRGFVLDSLKEAGQAADQNKVACIQAAHLTLMSSLHTALCGLNTELATIRKFMEARGIKR